MTSQERSLEERKTLCPAFWTSGPRIFILHQSHKLCGLSCPHNLNFKHPRRWPFLLVVQFSPFGTPGSTTDPRGTYDWLIICCLPSCLPSLPSFNIIFHYYSHSREYTLDSLVSLHNSHLIKANSSTTQLSALCEFSFSTWQPWVLGLAFSRFQSNQRVRPSVQAFFTPLYLL